MSEHNDVEELVQHLANLTFLFDFFEKRGNHVANKWVAKEFDAYNNELIEKLREVYDETRQKRNGTSRTQARTDIESGESGRRGSVGPSDRPGEGVHSTVRGEGL